MIALTNGPTSMSKLRCECGYLPYLHNLTVTGVGGGTAQPTKRSKGNRECDKYRPTGRPTAKRLGFVGRWEHLR